MTTLKWQFRCAGLLMLIFVNGEFHSSVLPFNEFVNDHKVKNNFGCQDITFSLYKFQSIVSNRIDSASYG